MQDGSNSLLTSFCWQLDRMVASQHTLVSNEPVHLPRSGRNAMS